LGANLLSRRRVAARLEGGRLRLHLRDLTTGRVGCRLRFLRQTLGLLALRGLALRRDLRDTRRFRRRRALLIVDEVAADAAGDDEHADHREHRRVHALAARRLDALDLLLVLEEALLLRDARLLLGL